MSKRWQVGLQLKHVQEVLGSVWDARMGKACRGHGWDQDERACLFCFCKSWAPGGAMLLHGNNLIFSWHDF